MKRRRRGFLFTMPLMLGMGILIFSSMIAISQLFVTIGGPMVPDLLADMPTIFHYTQDGQRVPEYLPVLVGAPPDGDVSEQEFAESFPAIAMYGLMVKISLGIFVILLMLAGLSYFFEEFNIVRQGTAYGIIAKMIVLIPIYLVLPYLWDTVALVVESSSLYLMDPFGGDPHGKTTELWCKMGSVACSTDGSTSINPLNIFDNLEEYDRDSTLSQDSWNNALQNPILGEDFIVNVLLALFKGFAIMFMTAMMFVLSAVRVMLTEVIVISFPLVSAIGLIPWINTARISSMFQQNLIGLTMAPIMSALVLSIGLSTIDAQNMPPLRMWFQLLSVGFMAVFFPVMLSPMLGNISSRVGSMVSSSITSASVAGSAGLRGFTRGISQASSATSGANMAMGGRGGSSQAGRFSSADMGMSTSGANMSSGMSTMDRMKMYGKAGIVGMLSGLGSGMIQTSTGSMGMGNAGAGAANNMVRQGDVQIENMVQNTSANGAANTISQRMTEIESGGVGAEPLHTEKHTVMNPGSNMESMVQNNESFDAGRRLTDDPAARKEFVNMYSKKMGLDNMSPDAQDKFGTQVEHHIRKHPSAAGRMFRDMKDGDSA